MRMRMARRLDAKRPLPRVPLRPPNGVLRSTRSYSDSPQRGFQTRYARRTEFIPFLNLRDNVTPWFPRFKNGMNSVLLSFRVETR
jgi:hypothetical protein